MGGHTPVDRSEVELDLLRQVLELTVVVAQAGQRVTPVVAAPTLLRPYLRFTHKVPGPALRVARRVLDEDDEWRARVALVANDELVGRAGTLFAQRPEGWQEELAGLVDEAVAARHSGAAGQAGRHADRRLTAAEESARRSEANARLAEEALTKLRVELATAQAQLSAESARSEAAEQRVDRMAEELRAAEVRLDGLLRSLAAAEEARAALEQSYVHVSERAAELGVLAEQRDSVVASTEVALADLDHLRASLIRLRDGVPTVDPSAARSPVEGGDGSRRTLSRAERAAARASMSTRGQRVPLALPPAVFAESVDAARHLVRAVGALVLVDGYNVAKSKWGGINNPSELRSRLDAALADVATRANADVVVVYDGNDEGGMVRQVGAGRRSVRVVFSSAEVEADDVLLDMVAETPPWRPVVVISSDRRVRDGASRLGANVVGSQQFTASWGASG